MQKDTFKYLEEECKNNGKFNNEYLIQEQHLEIAKQLKKLREEKGMSQKELSEKTGLKQQAISILEHYTTPPNLLTLIKYLNGLGIDLLSLLKQA